MMIKHVFKVVSLYYVFTLGLCIISGFLKLFIHDNFTFYEYIKVILIVPATIGIGLFFYMYFKAIFLMLNHNLIKYFKKRRKKRVSRKYSDLLKK